MNLADEKRLWIPDGVENIHPVDGREIPEDRRLHINTVPGEIEVADLDTMMFEVRAHGLVLEEPEIGRARSMGVEPPPLIGTQAYEDVYWTHFNFRRDVKRAVTRVQKQFPWLTYANTYFKHPPVYRRKYEFVSVDYWGGGIVNGRYVGYRGKDINLCVDGWKVFNAAFNDPYLPNIYWAIYGGYMWVRGQGWMPAPWGPPGSDPLHLKHIHITYLL